MAAGLSDRDRKLLWGRSASLCAICHVPLIVEGSKDSHASIIGEEAHIVGRSIQGPRGNDEEQERWSYDNFILLCPSDHSLIDAQSQTYSSSRLRQIKRDHESWVATRLRDHDRLDGPRNFPENWPLRLSDRTVEYALITAVLDEAEQERSTRVAVVTGLGGVGKTALSSYWFMQKRDRFHSGQLLADCSRRGHGSSVDISDLLATFLRELDVDEEVIPPTLSERRKLFRRLTADRKLLILLDDVEHPAQVTSLLPTGAGSLVLATSQHRLEELLFDGAQPITLQPLNPETSRQFLVERLGESLVATEGTATDRLINLCGGLPVTLCVCAAKASMSGSITRVVDRIEQAQAPLAEMSGGARHSVQVIFDFAYAELSEGARALYRSLGLFEGRDIGLPAAAALAGITAASTAQAMNELEDIYFVEPLRSGYRQHDLVREHANQMATSETVDARRSAIKRLIDWYYGALRTADLAVTEDRLRLSSTIDIETLGSPEFATAADAFTWFDQEWVTILSTLRQARDIEWFERVWQIAEALWPFCYNLKLYSLWIEAYSYGVEAALALDDACVEARMRSGLARAYSDQGEFDRASAEMTLSVKASERCDNERLQASIIEFDGIMRFERGDAGTALARFQEARAMFVAAQSYRGVAIQDYQIGKSLMALGANERALAPLKEAGAGFLAFGDDIILGRVLHRQGEALLALGRYMEARQSFTESMTIAERLDLRHDQAQLLESLAELADVQGDRPDARRYRELAKQLYRAIGHPRSNLVTEPEGLTGLGDQAS
jgi:tetratricopeptide (TPR) repeat protein